MLSGATLVAFLTGCVPLDKFDTGDDSVFAGRVLGADDDDCSAASSCSFIRRGFASDTRLEMTFHPDRAQSEPGNLTTRGEPCDIALDDVPMEPITPLTHDQLGLYDFPGGARVRNYIFGLRPPTGPLSGRDVMAFVSLLSDGGAEIRVVAGSGAMQCDPNDCATINAGGCDYYGLFLLGREPR